MRNSGGTTLMNGQRKIRFPNNTVFAAHVQTDFSVRGHVVNGVLASTPVLACALIHCKLWLNRFLAHLRLKAIQ